MKKRNITYGYHIVGGELHPHPEESRIVREIFQRYAAGESLRTLAEDLTRRQVEFFPGKSGWDKARVKRVLDERRYFGEKEYPPLIGESLYQQAGERKQQVSTAVALDPEIKTIKDMVACQCCGRRLNLKCDYRLVHPEAWYCATCKLTIRISHATLKEGILRLQQRLIDDPSSIREEKTSHQTISLETKRLTHELHRQMDAGNASEEELIQMALQCAAETYNGITSARHITDRLTAVLQSAGPLSALDTNLLRTTVRQIRLSKTGEIALYLKNGRLYKEDSHDRDSRAEQSDGDPGQAQRGAAGRDGESEAESGGLLPGVLAEG